VTFKLTNASNELDDKIEVTRDKISEARENAKAALKIGNKSKAMSICREKKLLEKMETTMIGMKMKIEQQIMDINLALSTKSTIE